MAAPMFDGIQLISLHVNDFDKCLAFYRDTMGLECEEVNQEAGWGQFKLSNGVTFGIHRDDCAPDGRRAGGTTGFFIAVPNATAAEAELKARGVEITQGVTELPYGKTVAWADPDGNEFVFIEFAQG